MDGSIRLSREQRKVLLAVYRSGGDAARARRAHILLLLDDGWSYRAIQEATYASFDLIRGCVQRFQRDGLSQLIEQEPAALPAWLQRVVDWLSGKTPQDFGYFRSRWSCETLAEVLAWEAGVRRSAETVRRGLQRAGFVWRRPRPVLGPRDPERAEKLQKIRSLLQHLGPDEVAVFQDEVDIHLNPKIGSCWMRRGEQVEVITPGQNVKRHLAGSWVWRTGRLLVSKPGERRNAEMFVQHLDDLRSRLRGYRLIHVICDNARFHDCRAVRDYLRTWGHRLRLHFLPKYAPETNPIERIWWRLHETITRNHRCGTMDELLQQVAAWIDTQRYFLNRTIPEYAQAA